MSRPRFGLDLDGIIYAWHSAARFLLMHYRGLNLPPVDKMFSHWNGHRDYITPEDESWLWSEGVEKGLFRHGHIHKGAVEFCQDLNDLVDIVVITHRPIQARQDTLDWISFHKIPTSEIHMLHDEQDKSRVLVDIALDDKPENADAFARAGVHSLLWDRPWNRNTWDLGVDTHRVWEWEEVLGWAKAIEKTKTALDTKPLYTLKAGQFDPPTIRKLVGNSSSLKEPDK